MQLVGGRTGAGASSLGSTTNRKPMLIALALGLIAAMLSWGYVQRAGQATRPAALVPVLVAAVDIPVRTQVTPQMLAVKQVAVDARHPKAFTSADQVTGKMTNLAITAGEQVLSTKFFARKEDSGLAFRIAPGKRAVSVSVSEVISTSGLIVPGDFVDVVSLFAPLPSASGSPAGNSQDSVALVLQNIEVLAIAQDIQGVAFLHGKPTQEILLIWPVLEPAFALFHGGFSF